MTISILDKSKIPSLPESKRELEHHFAEHLDSLAYPLLARIYLAEGDLERTRKVCSIGLKHHPHHAPGLFLLALASLRESNLPEAESLLLKTLSYDQYHVEAAELLVAVQERLHRKKSVLEQAYQQLLKANPLSRAAQLRLDRIRAERELVRGVQDHLREKRGDPAEPIPEQPKTLKAKLSPEADAPAPGEPFIEQPEVEIKAEVIDAAADTAAPGTLFYEESTAEQGQPDEIQDIPATIPIIEEAPAEPVIEDIEEGAGQAGEVIDIPELVQEGEPLEPLQPAEPSEPADQPVTAEIKPEETTPEEPDLDDEMARAKAYWAELEPSPSDAEAEDEITGESIARDEDLEKADVSPGVEDVGDGDVGPFEEGDEKLVIDKAGELQAFEPGILTTPADKNITAQAHGDDGADTYSTWPGVPPVDRPDNWEDELQELVNQESRDLIATRESLAEESTPEQAATPAEAEQPEKVEQPTADQSEEQAFEPGASYVKEDRLVDETVEPVTPDDTAAEKFFEPGAPEVTEDVEAEEDQDLSIGQAVEDLPGQPSITTADAGDSAEVAPETEKSEEDLFEPRTAATPADGGPEEEDLSEEVSSDKESAAEPAWPGASSASDPGPREGVPEDWAELEAKDLTIEQRPFIEESSMERATAAETELPQSRDLEQETFEPGEEQPPTGMESEDADLQDRATSAEPHRSDVVFTRRETEAEKAIATEDISEVQDTGEAGILPGTGSVREDKTESPEEVKPPAADQPKEHMFEPGTDYTEKERPVDEAEEPTVAEALFKPGTLEVAEEPEPEEDLDLSINQTVEEEPVSSSTPVAAEVVDLIEDIPETEKAEEDLFEPGTAGSEDGTEEEGLTDAASDKEKPVEESIWPEKPLMSGSAPIESTPEERAELETRDLTATQRPLPAEPTAEQAAAEGEADTTVTPEDRDLEREPFEPGEQPLAEEAESEEATLERPAPAERAEEEPYRPDVESLEHEAEVESTVIDQAALDEGKMVEDSFEPSSVQPETPLKPVPEIESEPTVPAEDDFEFEAEFQAAREAEDQATLGIDPKLATFTLATIYKVQGLYHQALQVLEAVATKGGDPERIMAERETILQLMASDIDIEPE